MRQPSRKTSIEATNNNNKKKTAVAFGGWKCKHFELILSKTKNIVVVGKLYYFTIIHS